MLDTRDSGFDMKLQQMRCDLAALNVQLKLCKLSYLLRKYSPGQPRVPAGSPEGGQWTSGGGGGGGVDTDAADDDAQIQLVQGDSLQGYPVDLRQEEDRGGHTIERHVARSEADLKTEVQQIARSMVERDQYPQGLRVGSFTSLDSATELVNSTLAQNRDVVSEVVRGQRRAAEVDAVFDSPTGYEAFLPAPHLYRICAILTAYAWSSPAIQALPAVTGCTRPFQEIIEVAMPDQEEYAIEIYFSPSGVVTDSVLHGKLEYLQAKMFLNMLTERTYKPEHMPRPIPDRGQDWYELTIDQYNSYQYFLKRLRAKSRPD